VKGKEVLAYIWIVREGALWMGTPASEVEPQPLTDLEQIDIGERVWKGNPTGGENSPEWRSYRR
jgi:hypothetical protein